MMWCFAKVNSKLAEIYFEKDKKGKNKVFAHCYVDSKDFKSKKEKLWIRNETKKFAFTYKNKKYIEIN